MVEKRISDLFAGLGIFFSACLLLLMADQAAFFLSTRIIGKSGALRYPMEDLKKAYGTLDEAAITALLSETWLRALRYQPYVQFVEKEFHGRYVNVHANGMRLGRPSDPWPPDSTKTVVFVFGGSTTFGTGVADTQTVPFYLGAALGDSFAVYNFGCANYFDTQERIRFEQLVYEGAAPDIAVFIDGVNLFDASKEGPYFTPTLRHLFQNGAKTLLWLYLKTSFAAYCARGFKPYVLSSDFPDRQSALRRYRTNMAAIERTAAAYAVTPFFVLQPTPFYGYDYSGNPFLHSEAKKGAPDKEGYVLLKKMVSGGEFPVPGRWIDLSEIQRNRQRLLYVDAVHYTPAFSREIADSIARRILPAPVPR